MAFYPQGITLKALLENPDLLNPPILSDENKEMKKDKNSDSLDLIFNPQSAFLGPQLWDKTLPYDSNDLKLEYMDLDEFLEENGIPLTEEQSKIDSENGKAPNPMLSPPQLIGEVMPVNPTTLSPNHSSVDVSDESALVVKYIDQPGSSKDKYEESPNIDTTSSKGIPVGCPALPGSISPVVELNVSAMDLALAQVEELDSKIDSHSTLPVSQPHGNNSQDYKLNPDDLALARVPGQEEFDPRQRKFSEEELRPQPMMKKAKKIFVHEEAKDDKYWSRRKKNNVAAKRSRDARRIKENQIALRASFLENQADLLRKELVKSKAENCELKRRLAKYE